jgi:uncharacterized protein (TIGR03382 family)
MTVGASPGARRDGRDRVAPALLSLGRMPSRLLAGFAALLLLGTAARAQTITMTFPGGITTTLNKGPGTCNDTVRVNWSTTGLSTAIQCGSGIQIWVTNSNSCGTSPGTSSTDGGSDFVLDTQPLTTTTGTESFVVSQMPGLANLNCANQVIDVTNSVCASAQYRPSNVTDCTTSQASTLNVRYDTQPPSAPSLSLLPQDGRIVVSFSPNGSNTNDILNYQAEYAVQPSDTSAPQYISTGQVSAQSARIEINGLVNGTTYLVRGYAFDEVDNRSSASDPPQTGTPEATDGFWGRYKQAGGDDLGGCSATGIGLPSAIFGLAVLAALVRRRR